MSCRVAAYIDGFNLYHGLKDHSGRKFLWLNVEALAQSLCRSQDQLDTVKYFTADVRDKPQSHRRQAVYLTALMAYTTVDLSKGRFQEKHMRCFSCKHWWKVYEEKETDVAIAADLIEDAVMDRWDRALLISADADLCPAVRAVKRPCPEKTVIAAFPPRRSSDELKNMVHGAFTINTAKIRKSQLPDPVIRPDGSELRRPGYWA